MHVKTRSAGFFRGCLASVALLVVPVLPAWGQVIQSGLLSRPYFGSAGCCPSGSAQPFPEGRTTEPSTPTPTEIQGEPAFAAARAPAGQGEMVALRDSNTGYIDSALIGNEFRLRYDSAYDDNRPDRAEFFYAKCGCFRTAPPPLTDPHAPGPPKPETSVDYQDISAYAELAFGSRFSGFVEVPVRFLNPEQNDNTSGLADMNVGAKYAFIQDAGRVATFQLRCYIPTGAGSRGLGTDHVSLEPALLLFQRLTDRLTLEAELRDWVPIGGTDFEGNVLRYGVGLGYTVYQTCSLRITPVVEMVGWTVLSGKEAAFPDNVVTDAAGDTIVNAKVGLRLGLGERSSIYVGYGRALTGAVWYKDIIRAEYYLFF
jgi:hypothetical protein